MSDLRGSFKLEQSSIIKLVDLTLIDGSRFSFCDKYDLIFRGIEYKHLNFEISGLKDVSSDELVRPKFKMLNPMAIFSKLAVNDKLEGAIFDLTRIPEDEVVSGNLNTLLHDRWKVYSVPVVNQEIELSLRRLSDLITDRIPPRRFSPPDFPTINLR